MSRKHSTNGTVGILYRVIEINFTACFYGMSSGINDLFVQNVIQIVVLCACAIS